MSEERKVEFWSCNSDDEHLFCTDMHEAVHSYLDNLEDVPPEKVAELVYPEKVTAHGFARMEPTVRPGRYLEIMLEDLEEEYGNPDGDGADVTGAMVAAADAFAEVVLHEYSCWACEPVTSVEVELAEYLAARSKP